MLHVTRCESARDVLHALREDLLANSDSHIEPTGRSLLGMAGFHDGVPGEWRPFAVASYKVQHRKQLCHNVTRYP